MLKKEFQKFKKNHLNLVKQDKKEEAEKLSKEFKQKIVAERAEALNVFNKLSHETKK